MLQVIKMTPDAKAKAKAKEKAASTEAGGLSPDPANKSDLLDDEEDFFDFISRFRVLPKSPILHLLHLLLLLHLLQLLHLPQVPIEADGRPALLPGGQRGRGRGAPGARAPAAGGRSASRQG